MDKTTEKDQEQQQNIVLGKFTLKSNYTKSKISKELPPLLEFNGRALSSIVEFGI